MTNNNTQPGFYGSRPSIKVADQLRDELGENQLLSLVVEETIIGLFRCEARFANWGTKNGKADLLYFDRQLLDFGKAFSVEFGPPNNVRSVFTGRIMGLEAQFPKEGSPELTVLAEDRFQDLRMERRTRTFENSTDADVIRQIASAHSLTPQIDVDGPTYRTLAQVNQSDLAFLRERVAAIDADLWIDDRTLHAQTRANRDTTAVPFTYGTDLLEFSVLADLAHQRSSVKVSGWDVKAKEAIDEQAAESVISGELNGGRSGSSILGQALAERHERITSAVPLSKDEAQKMAQARYRERARSFIQGTGSVIGNPKVRVGTTVDLSGLGPLFDGKYFVTLARHTFDVNEGYLTTFEVSRSGIGN